MYQASFILYIYQLSAYTKIKGGFKMVIIFKPSASKQEILKVKTYVESLGNITAQPIEGQSTTILGLVGDTASIDAEAINLYDCVDRIMKVAEAYKKANRKFHPDNTVIDVRGRKIGGNEIAIIAGPCSVESQEQIDEVAGKVCAYGAGLLRGGAYKPRTSPYAFQGMGPQGLELLYAAGKKYDMPVVSEIMHPNHLDIFLEKVDIIQVGARNMQNFELLKELGRIQKPILLKRGFAATIEELLMSAEYILAEGNPNVILCERGIRTFEPSTRNSLDLSSIPIIKRNSHLPVIVDPSHATGLWWMVEPMSKAAIAAGADGLIIEVHNNPQMAKCDGQQSITPASFEELLKKLCVIAQVEGREIKNWAAPTGTPQ